MRNMRHYAAFRGAQTDIFFHIDHFFTESTSVCRRWEIDRMPISQRADR